MNVKEILGSNIQKFRKLKKLTQDQLAEILDISAKHMSIIEVGKKFPSADLIDKISNTLDVSYASLFKAPLETFKEEQLNEIEGAIDRETQSFTDSLKRKIRDLS